MSSVVIPGQPRRWGNESTNFFQASFSQNPGDPSRQKVYRCAGHQYTNCGHYHVGAKALNRDQPLDSYGTPTERKLRLEDQRLPKALTTSSVMASRMTPDHPVNLCKSHQQRYHSYAMATTPRTQIRPAQFGGGGGGGGGEDIARSLNKAFYITSYQSDIAKHAAQRGRTSSEGDCPTLRGSLEACRSQSMLTPSPPRGVAFIKPRPPSAPQPRPPDPRAAAGAGGGHCLQRRRSFSAIQQSFPTKAEMVKEIFMVFPAPRPGEASKRQGRPSSAVALQRGKIPELRQRKSAWV